MPETNWFCYAPTKGALSDDARLTSICLTSVAYIGPKSRIERPRKTKIGTEVDHVTRDLDTTFKVGQRSRSRARRGHIHSSAVTHAPFHASVLRPTSWPNAQGRRDGEVS